MKKIFYLLVIFYCFASYCQNKYYYNVIFNSSNDVPQVVSNAEGTKKLIFKDNRINAICDKYIIYHCCPIKKKPKRWLL